MKFGTSTFLTDQGIGPPALALALEERGFGSLFIAEQIDQVRSRAGRDVPVSVYGVPGKPGVIDGYAGPDVERLLPYLPTLPERETLAHLDDLAEVAARQR